MLQKKMISTALKAVKKSGKMLIIEYENFNGSLTSLGN